jgi:toxin FitB
MFIMDTDVLSDMRKQKKHAAVQAWLLEVPQTGLCTPVISIAEIKCGIERQRPLRPQYGEGTQAWLDGFLLASNDQILGLGVQAALVLAEMHEAPALRNFITADPRQKRRQSPADLAIAAIAIAAGATVATGNQSHFEEIHRLFPLPGLYNLFMGVWAADSSRHRH